MPKSSEYERNGQLWDPLGLPLLHEYRDIAAWERIGAVAEHMAATAGRYGSAVEERDRSQLYEKLRAPAETGSEEVYHLEGEYARPMQGFPLTLEAYVVLKSLGQEIPPVSIDEPPVA